MGRIRYRISILLLGGFIAAALVAAAFAPVATTAAGAPTATPPHRPTPTPTPPPTPSPSPAPAPELAGATEIVGWGIVVAFAWVVHPLVGLLLFIAALAFTTGDRRIVAQVAAIALLLFSPVYTLVKAALGGRRK